MQVSRWGNSLAIRLPVALVEALALKEGDDIDVRIAGERAFYLNRAPDRAKAFERLRALRKPLPPGWSFDRSEANER